MLVHSARLAFVATLLGLCVYYGNSSTSQEPPPIRLDPPAAPGDIPKGIEVQARGPIHEGFASPSAEPKPTHTVPKGPPPAIEEMPPDEKPEGDVTWIGGYWAWDDDRADFLWVSGCWRIKPTNKEWVPGYWRELGANWQWVPGFWTNAQEGRADSVTYYPEPPAPPNLAPVGDAPAADTFYVPGYWMWSGNHYVWRVGYWSRVRPGYVYMPSHYRWTPTGYVFISGYWDLAVSRRGVLYAPVVIDRVALGPRYVYTPYYAVRDTIVLDTMFVRPVLAHYYFGDYYGPRYAAVGFEPAIVYSRRHYEPIIVYERWHYRENPRWYDSQITLVVERNAGRAALPPRTLVQQNIIVKNSVTNVTNVTNVIAPAKTVVVARGEKIVPVDANTRLQVRQATQIHQQNIAADRRKTEATVLNSAPVTKPRTAPLNVVAVQPRPPMSGNIQPKTGSTTTKPNPFADPKIPPVTVAPKETTPRPFDKGKSLPPEFKKTPTVGTQPPPGTKGGTPVGRKKDEKKKQ